jgi:hypothetical protein
LFDTPRLVRRLELLFEEMWSDLEIGRLPAPDLTNLDVYADIGTELNLAADDQQDQRSFRDRYLERLRNWHRVYPLRADGRHWDGGTP